MNAEKNDINRRENKGEVFIRKWLEFTPMIIFMICLSLMFGGYDYESTKNIIFKDFFKLLGVISLCILILVGSRIFFFFFMAFFGKLNFFKNFILLMKSLLLESLFYYLTFFTIGIIVSLLDLDPSIYLAIIMSLTFVYMLIYFNAILNARFIKKQ